MPPRRLLIVSNRLPVTVQVDDDQVFVSAASGGLATGLRRYHERSSGVWIGWPGVTQELTASQRDMVDREFAEHGIVPLYLTDSEVREYYEDFSNGVLWPVFHYLLERIPLSPTTWQTYQRVNERFADLVAAQYQSGDMIWVHDYHLLLLPGLLRRRLPDARIGFFLHIPFPADEVFRILPWRREILEGLLGADLVGFHTYAYVQHFAAALGYLSRIEPEEDRVWLDEREVRFGVYPMGIDAEAFRQLSVSSAVQEELAAIKRDVGDRRLLLGVDRLDYTKGLRQRLVAFERLLQDDPSLRDALRLIQVAVPSRDAVPSYQEFRRELEEMIGRINGTYGTVTSVPIHYLHQSVSSERLVALYRAADVMLVTPLRDGMNLVAKEYVASRVDDDGVLILSEFAGAAEELHGAVSVNAYDVGDLTAKMHVALAMASAERSARMSAMRRWLMAHDVNRWANDFVRALDQEAGTDRRPTAAATLNEALGHLRAANLLAILLDYDGTLVPIANTPDLALPDPDLITLIAALARRPNTIVQMVSGRARDTLDAWFGALPIGLWAEHGAWFRAAPAVEWESALTVPCCDWMPEVHAMMEEFSATTPGTFVEKKHTSIAWHYRQAARGYGRVQARELRLVLSKALVDRPIEIMEGKRVLEVRSRGASRAVVVQRLLSRATPPTAILAFGDDRTDEELFAALPPSAVAVHVGSGASLARHRLHDPAATRNFLEALLP
jgi:trehalose 6-phosphate synthase/phosphatase